MRSGIWGLMKQTLVSDLLTGVRSGSSVCCGAVPARIHAFFVVFVCILYGVGSNPLLPELGPINVCLGIR